MSMQRIEIGQRDAAAPACGCGHAGGCVCGDSHHPQTNTGGASTPAAHVATANSASEVTELSVDGMTCDHCVRAVTAELSALPGVEAVDVDLVAGGASRVRVSAIAPLDRTAAAAAIAEAGYSLRG